MDDRIVSADDHIDMPWLPKDLWQKRVPPRWRERAPRVVDGSDGPHWVCGDDRWEPWGGRTGAAGARGGRRTAFERGGALEPGVLRPATTALKLADMDRDGVDATVMYPHADSTWPESPKAIEENFRGIASATRRRILCDNAKELHGLGAS